MSASGSLQLSMELGLCRNHQQYTRQRFRLQNVNTRVNFSAVRGSLSSISQRQYSWSSNFSKRIHRRVCTIPCRSRQFQCHCFSNPVASFDASSVKNATLTLARSFNHLQSNPLVMKIASAVGIVVFAIWGLGPLVRFSRNLFLHKTDNSWKKSSTYLVTTSYIQPMLLWAGAIFICRALDPMILPTEAGQIVKQRLLNFVRALSTVLAFAYCFSSVIEQAQKFFIETSDPTNTRNMGFQFAGKAVYTGVWVAAVSLFMELLGFSTQKWLTAGGLGTVLLTLAGREIFTNFLSSAMIHATRPFVVNEWIQTKIEGYDVSGTVEHVGWWSPTIVRGEDREAVHIPNHKFTVNVVRNLSQKTHWRIKTHFAISHLDVSKINNIVADMRKVLAKNPQVEQQKLHRRVFLDNINPENQALLILVSCFVKTSHFEEYLCVKEAIFLDMLRVIRHHRARLATPIRTVQKIFTTDVDLDNIPFSESMYSRGATSNRPLLLIEPSYKINGEEKTKPQSRPARVNGEEETNKPTVNGKTDTKSETIEENKPTVTPTDSKSDSKVSTSEVAQMPKVENKEDTTKSNTVKSKPLEEIKVENKDDTTKSLDSKVNNSTKSSSKAVEETNSNANTSNKKKPQKATQEKSSVSTSATQEAKQSVTQVPVTKTSLEENMVLGVALDGSKRTLPIEEEMGPITPTNVDEVKELASLRSGGGSGPALAEKDKGDVKRPTSVGSPPDQVDKQD